MALYTKKLIMSTFQAMLEELPFDKITVAALTKRAGGEAPPSGAPAAERHRPSG